MGCKVQESWWKKQAKGVQKTGNGVQKRQGWVQANKTGKWVQEVQTRGSKKTEGVIKRNARGSKETSEKVEEGRQK